MRHLVSLSSGPWLCLGDFNELLHDSEKQGGNQRAISLMQAFREAIDDCSLRDMGVSGPWFTWYKHMGNGDVVLERLDRGLCNLEWGNLYPSAVLSTKFFGSQTTDN